MGHGFLLRVALKITLSLTSAQAVAPQKMMQTEPALAVPIVTQALPEGIRAEQVIVRSSIEAALTAKMGALGRPLAAEAARLLRWRGRLSKLVRPNDRLLILYGPKGLYESSGPNPILLGLSYQGALLQLNAYRFAGADNIFRYYDAEGRLVEPHMLHAPVPEYEQITEIVQAGRGARKHRGVDLKAPEGAQVILPFSGTVRRLNWGKRHNGRCVEVELDAGYLAHFLHLRQVDAGLHVGAYLHAGTPLGTVGSTGRSSGPHLHYELLRHGRPVEPLIVHGRRTVQLGPSAMRAYQQVRDAMMRAMSAG